VFVNATRSCIPCDRVSTFGCGGELAREVVLGLSTYTSQCAAVYNKENHASCFAIAARRLSNKESVNALIAAAKQLL
jgi:hypothetical protein